MGQFATTPVKRIENISKEWAALPKDKSNKSYYDSDGKNKALIDYNKLKDLLEN